MRWSNAVVMAAVLTMAAHVYADGLPNNPDLIYTAATGNVKIDADGAEVGSLFLESLNGEFLPPADFSDLDDDVGFGTSTQVDNTANNIGWISVGLLGGIGFDGPGLANIGNIFPTSLDLDGLDALLLRSGWSIPGGGGGDFDLIISTPTVLQGDYNGDALVNAADYAVWLNNLGGTSLPNNETESIGTVDLADYTAWKTNIGSVAGSGSLANSHSIPEPSTVVLYLASAIAVLPLVRAKP